MVALLRAGAAQIDITPKTSQFLFGYPHVERYSDGVDTSLYSSSLFIDDGNTKIMFIGNDLIYLSKQHVAEIREKISKQVKILPENIMITCTHTHSGPGTVERIARKADDVVPPPDPEYITWCIGRIAEGAVQACLKAEPVKIGFAIADATGVGTNRRDPAGPANPLVPVLTIKATADDSIKAIMLACSMHPTVLHEDSKLISADFPGYCRKYLQENIADCPIIYHTSPAGNQSPRHVTRENTPAETKRIGEILGRSVENAIGGIEFENEIKLTSVSDSIDLPLNDFPDLDTAAHLEKQARSRFDELKEKDPQAKETRTAECDWFGAERRLHLAQFNESGDLAIEVAKRLPAEVQVIRVGKYTFVSWPGEIFVEYCLEIMNEFENTFVIAYANGETQGYLVTPEAVKEGGYEASTAIFKSPQSPNMLVEKTRELLRSL